MVDVENIASIILRIYDPNVGRMTFTFFIFESHVTLTLLGRHAGDDGGQLFVGDSHFTTFKRVSRLLNHPEDQS